MLHLHVFFFGESAVFSPEQASNNSIHTKLSKLD